MKKILITGCNGQLGRAMNIELANEDYELINTDVEDLDITNIEAVRTFINDTKPTVVINCAAHTAVDLCETQRDSAYKINAIGPRNLSIAATEVGAKIVQISTDYVFAGDGDKPYTEFDKTNPQSVYGETKLAGENFVKEFSDKYFIIRTAWLYGDGKNFVKTMLRLAEENSVVTVVGDQYGTPTSAKELAKMIHYLIETSNYGIFNGTCEGQCSWADFSKEIFRLAGKDVETKYITSDEYKAVAKRPAYSVLDNYMLRLTSDFTFADWKDAIADYIKEII